MIEEEDEDSVEDAGTDESDPVDLGIMMDGTSAATSDELSYSGLNIGTGSAGQVPHLSGHVNLHNITAGDMGPPSMVMAGTYQ
jgi:hypothetical protein